MSSSSSSSKWNYGLVAGYLGVIGVGLSGYACGDESSAAVVTLRAELRVPQGDGVGSYQYVPATRIAQGQEIDYTVRITNPGASPMLDATVVQALPGNTHYVAGSATGAGADIQFSVDGGRTFGKSAVLKSPVHANAIASAHEYTHIRWQLRHPLAPKAVVLARFRAVFE